MSRSSKRDSKSWRPPGPKVLARMETRTVCGLLVRTGEEIHPELFAAIVARGADAVEPLLAIATRETPGWTRDGPYLARGHALRLLREVGDERAVGTLLKLALDLWVPSLDFWLGDQALQALQAQRPPALEPVLAAYAEAEDPETRHMLISTAACLGVRDERIWTGLLAFLEEAPGEAAGALANYGDPAALPLLHAALERAPLSPPRERGGHDNFDFIELEDAIRQLGGELTAGEQVRADLLTQWFPHRHGGGGDLDRA